MTIESHLDIFESGRPAMKKNNQDLLRLAVLVEQEFHEFIDAWLDFLCDPTQESAQETGQEAADVALFLAQCMRAIGSTLEGEMLDKIAFNTSRFAAIDFDKETPYTEAYTRSKQWVRDTGWKKSYYSEQRVKYRLDLAQR
jgi:hypothetical protein